VKMTAMALFALAAVLLLLSPLVAGCLSIPGPEAQLKTPAITATPTVSHTAKVTTVKTTRTPVVTPTPLPATTTLAGVYESANCTQQGGTEVVPGQQCRGTWLPATDTFSCCSTKPVPAGTGNLSVTASSFNLTVGLDDSPGSILP
jgi:hypothetical protein